MITLGRKTVIVRLNLMLQIMAAERKARMEVDDLKQQLQSRGQDVDRKRRGPDEETLRKIRRLEDTIAELQKNLAAQKQVCKLHFALPETILG